MTSAVAETSVIGDPANGQNFKDASGIPLAAGDVIWTAYTTNDTTAPSTSATLNLNGRDFLTFRGLLMIGGNANPSVVTSTTTNSVNIVFRDCTFITVAAGNSAFAYTGLADVASNWTIDRCIFAGSTSGSCIFVTLPTSGTADYDSNFLVQNCIVTGSYATFVNVSASGALSFKGGGVDVYNCTIPSRCVALNTGSANVSTSIPCTIYNCLIMSGARNGVSANTSGQIIEDFNRILAGTPRTNVTAGASSISDLSHAPLIEAGYDVIVGRLPRPFGMPMKNSPLLGRPSASSGTPTVDAMNRPRPSGGNSACSAWGAMERHDFGTKGASSGSSVLTLLGPGDHDFFVPLEATAASISAYGLYDSLHGAGSPPYLLITNGSEIGISDASTVMTAASGTWEQLTVVVTAASTGFVTARLVSRSAASGGNAYFRTFNVV